MSQSFTMTMHTLNKYGRPCVDVTDYAALPSNPSGNPATAYIERQKTGYVVRTKLQRAGLRYLYAYFYNGDDPYNPGTQIGLVDYIDLETGHVHITGRLQAVLSPITDYWGQTVDFPPVSAYNNHFMIFHTSNYGNYGYCRYEQDRTYALYLRGGLDMATYAPENAQTLTGSGILHTGNSGDQQFDMYDGWFVSTDLEGLLPRNILRGAHPINQVAIEQTANISYAQSGRVYFEALYDLTGSTDPDLKRVILERWDLLIGDLVVAKKVVQAWQLLSSDTIQWFNDYLRMDMSKDSDCEVTIFDPDFDDGSGLGVIGSASIWGRFWDGNLHIIVKYDLKTPSVTQGYWKVYDNAGHYRYDMIIPTPETYPEYEYVSPMIYGANYFYFLAYTPEGESYLFTHAYAAGDFSIAHVTNPFKGTSLEGPFKAANLELIDDTYMLVTTNGTHVTFLNVKDARHYTVGSTIVPITLPDPWYNVIQPQV